MPFLDNGINVENAVTAPRTKPKDFVQPKDCKAMATDLGAPWECYYYFLYWSASKFVHPSGLGSHSYVEELDQEPEISRSMTISFLMHYSLVDVLFFFSI